MRTSKAVVDGLSIEYLQAGLGQPGLLLCHGFTGAKEDFAAEIDDLADRGWHVVAPDLPGHGRSDHPDRDRSRYSTPAFASLLLSLADQLEWSRFVLLGHSMGGLVAQRVALHAPDRLEGLILMDTLHGPMTEDRGPIDAARHVAATVGLEALLELQRGRPDPLSSPAHERLLAERPGYREFCDRKLLESSPVMYDAVLGELVDTDDTLDRLRSFPAPTLVLVGEQDTLFIDWASNLADAIPNAQPVLISGAGHSPQFENPVVWRQAVYGFLDELVLARG